jgi:hypothetical protein
LLRASESLEDCGVENEGYARQEEYNLIKVVDYLGASRMFLHAADLAYRIREEAYYPRIERLLRRAKEDLEEATDKEKNSRALSILTMIFMKDLDNLINKLREEKVIT